MKIKFRKIGWKKRLLISFLSINIILVPALFLIVTQAHGAVRTWDGEGTDGTCGGGAGDGNKWSCAANWSSDTVPTGSDVATFDGTSSKDAVIDSGFAGSVAGVDINSGYTGTITVARSLTVGSSNFDQAAGTWDGANQNLDINDGSFTVSGGTHTATTGTFTVERSFTYSGGTLTMTGATVTLDGTGSDSGTVSCTGSLGGTLNISKTGGNQTVTIGSGCIVNTTSISLQGNLTVSGELDHTGTTWNMDAVISDGNITNNGTITFAGTDITTQGDITQNGTWDLSGVTITFDGNSSNQNPVISCTGTLGGYVVLTNTLNTSFTLNSGCTIEVTTFNNDGNITVNGTMNVTAPSITANATINRTFTINSGGIVNYTGGTDITLETNFILDPAGTFDLTGKTITMDGDNSNENQTITCTGELGGTWNLSNAAGASFTLSSGCTINVNDIINSGNITINGTMNVSGTFNVDNNINRTFSIGASGIVTYSGSSLNVATNFTLTSGGIFDLTGKTVTIDGGNSNESQTISCSEVLTGTWNFVNSSGSDATIGSGCTVNTTSINNGDNPNNDFTVNGTLIHTGSTFVVGGNLTVSGTGEIDYSGSSITITENLTQSGTFDLSGITVTFNGLLYDTVLTCTGKLGGLVDIAKTNSSADFTLSSGCEIDLVTNVDTTGTITNNGTINGTNINMESSLTQSGTLNLSGTLTLDGSSNSSNVSCSGPTNADIVLNKTSTGTMTLTGNCTILGNFTRTNGGINNPASAYTLTVEGDFSMSTTDAFGGANMTLAFGGPKVQTFTQNAGNISTPIVINKGANFLTLLTALTLDSTGNDLTITKGELRNAGFLLTIPGTFTINDKFTQGTGNVSFGTLTVGATGLYKNASTGDISVGAGGVANSGTMTFGDATSCGGSDVIAITSSSSPTQRDWTGSGTFNFHDIDVTDQAGSATITAYSSTSSNNGSNWTFNSSCEGGYLSPARIGNGVRLGNGARLR